MFEYCYTSSGLVEVIPSAGGFLFKWRICNAVSTKPCTRGRRLPKMITETATAATASESDDDRSIGNKKEKAAAINTAVLRSCSRCQ